MSWGTNRHIPTAEDIANMQKARKEAMALVGRLYKHDFQADVEALWKCLADKAGVKLTRHVHPKASKLIKFAKSIGLETDEWKEGLFGSYYKSSLQKAIDLHNSRLPEGQKESLRTMCAYILEGCGTITKQPTTCKE